MIVSEVLYLSVYLVVRMKVVVIFVRFYWCWWLFGAIGCDGGILVVVVMVTAVVRVATMIVVVLLYSSVFLVGLLVVLVVVRGL